MKASKTVVSYLGQTVYFGLDHHRKSWAVAPLFGETTFKPFTIFEPTAAELARRLKKMFPQANFVGVQEAGFSGYHLCRSLAELGIDLRLVNPSDVPTSQKDKLLKTDPRDAKRLSKLAQSGDYNSVYIPSRKQEFFRQLVRQRSTFVKDSTRIQNRIKQHYYFTGHLPEPYRFKEWSLTKRRLNELKTLASQADEKLGRPDEVGLHYIAQLEDIRALQLGQTRRIRQIIKEDHHTLYKLLLGCAGVGPVTAMTLIGELFDIDRFASFDHLVSYCGLMPLRHQSGERETAGVLIPRFNRAIRAVIIEAAWQATRTDPALTLYFNKQHKERGLHKNKAIVKVARKLLSRIYHVWKTGEVYQKGIS
ncbi:MAG: IS110 family transposase [Bacteroidota bacterium]